MKALLRPAFVFGLSIAIAVTSLVGSSSVAHAANLLITSLSLSGSVYEGDRPFLTGTFTGGAGQGPYTVDVDWAADGDFEDTFSFDSLDSGTFTVQKTVPYANEQNVTIVVVLSDPSFTNRKNMPGVTVLNAPPKFTSFALSATDVDEGQAVTATGAFTDGGANDTHTVTLNWGDLTLSTPTPAAGSFTSEHSYAGTGEFTVTATVTDSAGATAVATATVTVHVPNQAPSVVSFGVTAGSEGADSTLALTFADADALDTHTVAVSWGDGSSDSAVQLGAGVTTFVASHVYANSGTYAVELTLTDSANHTVTAGASVSPTNVAPALESLTVSPSSVVDHQTLTLSGSVSDPGTSDTFTLTVDWGDGSSSTPLVDTTRTFSATHSYDEAGPVTITVTVEDSDHATSTASVDLVVASSNHAPTGLVLDPSATGANVVVNASFTDADADDTHTLTVNWGDGATTSQFLGAGTTTYAMSHVYAASKTYTITATVTDPDGASTGATTSVAVTVASGSASEVLDEMSTLVQSFELDRNTERWLLKKIADTKASLAFGNSQVCSTTGTLSHLLAFGQRTLTSEQYAELKAFASKAEAAAGCSANASQLPKAQRTDTAVAAVTSSPTTQKKDATAKDEKKAAKADSKLAAGRGNAH